MTGLVLRPATRDDLELLVALRTEFLAELRGTGTGGLPGRLAGDTRRFLERSMASGGIHSWLAEEDGRPVGTVSVVVHDVPPLPEDPRSREGYVITMYVRSGSRGRGIGRSLLDACLGVAGDAGIRRFTLRTTAAGRPLYEAAGFAGDADWMFVAAPRDRPADTPG